MQTMFSLLGLFMQIAKPHGQSCIAFPLSRRTTYFFHPRLPILICRGGPVVMKLSTNLQNYGRDSVPVVTNKSISFSECS